MSRRSVLIQKYTFSSFLAFYLLELLVTNVEWASMLAELVKPVGDGGEGPERERVGGATVVSQVKGLTGVSDQTFPALFSFVSSGGNMFVYMSRVHKMSFCITQYVFALLKFLVQTHGYRQRINKFNVRLGT